MCALSKIRKENVALRPIVSTTGSPTYQLAKEIARILSPHVGCTESFVKNSTHFVQCMNQLTLEDSDHIVSFDIVSSSESHLMKLSRWSYMQTSVSIWSFVRTQCISMSTMNTLHNPPSSPEHPWFSSVSSQFLPILALSNFNSSYQHMFIMSPLHHYLYITFSHYGSCNSTDEDPCIETFRSFTLSLCYVNWYWFSDLDLSLEVHFCAT